MEYEVLATGSGGNCTVIDGRIAVDMGIPYKTIEPYVRDLQLVLLTHIHSDHFCKSTIKRLSQERPTLRFACCMWLAEPLLELGISDRVIDIVSCESWYAYKGVSVSPVPLVHNVPNCGWRISLKGSEKPVELILYATDTSTLENVVAKNYDLYLIEANHTKAEIEERIKTKRANDEYAYESDAMRNHLSQEQAMDWLAENVGANSIFVFMHQHKGVDD